jgi:predicted N-acetyltransferase YhbS
MFISRATRHDLSDITEHLARNHWDVVDPRSGTFFFARDGAVVGCIRFIEAGPQAVVVQDMVVDESRRGEGIGTALMRAAMNSRGGTLYLRCYEDLVPYYERFGFSILEKTDLPEPVAAYFEESGPLERETLFLSAR